MKFNVFRENIDKFLEKVGNEKIKTKYSSKKCHISNIQNHNHKFLSNKCNKRKKTVKLK